MCWHYPLFVIAGDQEQVDKVPEVQDRIEGLRHIIYPMRPAEVRPRRHVVDGNPQGDGRTSERAEMDRRRAQQTGATTCVVMLYTWHHGQAHKCRAVHDNIKVDIQGIVGVRQSKDGRGVLAYLPMAWVGDFIFLHRAGDGHGLHRQLPRNPSRSCRPA
jgi:long-chain acyl-CoA synthetase